MSFRSIAALLAACTLPGCTIIGTWEATRVSNSATPDGANHAPSRIEFRDDGTYAATVTYDDKETTNQGMYEWTGHRLMVRPRNRRARIYAGSLFGDTLRLKTKYECKTIRCTLRRISD